MVGPTVFPHPDGGGVKALSMALRMMRSASLVELNLAKVKTVLVLLGSMHRILGDLSPR